MTDAAVPIRSTTMNGERATSPALHVGLRGQGRAAGRRGEPPIVLLHAFPLDSRMWEPLMVELSALGIVAYGFDSPGFGVTPLWAETPSIDAIADAAVLTLKDGIGAGAAHWVGCSMGGYVALAIADRHPDAVAGMGLVDTRSTPDDEARRSARLQAAAEIDGSGAIPNSREMAEDLIGIEGQRRRVLIEKVTAMISDQSPSAVAWGQRAMATRPDRTRVLRGFQRPAVVVRGEKDFLTDPAETEAMAEALGIEVTQVPGVGHLSPLEAPSSVADTLALLCRRT